MINNSIEKQLRDCWQHFLNVENAGIHDNFFELGGDELLFEGLLHKLQQDFNINIVNIKRANFSTLYQQESLIKQQLNISHDSIILTLQEGKCDENIPIIVAVHPVGGSLFSFMPFITKMRSDNKIYGVQDCILTGDMRQFDTLKEQAGFYVAELKKQIMPGKKIILMGYSAGGLIANEMAFQFIQEGEIQVYHLVLFDSWIRMPSSISFRDNFLSIIVRNFDKIKPHSFFNTQEQIDHWLYEIIWSRMSAIFLHKPKFVDVNTTIFVPIEPVSEYVVDKDMIEGWSQLVRHVEIHYVMGTHENMLDEIDQTPIIEVLQPIFQSNMNGTKNK